MQNLLWMFHYFSIFFIFLHDVWRRRSRERSSLSHPTNHVQCPSTSCRSCWTKKWQRSRPCWVTRPQPLSHLGQGTQGELESKGRIGWLVLGARGSAASSKLSKTAEIRAWRQGLEWLEWVRGCTKPNFYNFLTLLSQSVSCRCLIFSLRQVVPSFEMPLMEISKRLEVESTHVHSVG